MDLYIYHHLGLGDHIICNALVRNIYSENLEKSNTIYLFCKKNNQRSVSFLYRDLIKLKLLLVNSDKEVEEYLQKNRKKNIIKIGFGNANFKKYTFDRAFYEQLHLDFKLRWENFFFVRDIEREKRLFKYYNLKEYEYVFLHDDKERNFVINLDYITKNNLKIVRPIKGLTDNIFDYCYLLENAFEIHCMDSSFKNLIDSLNPKTNRLFHHIYIRGRSNKNVSSSRLKWVKIYFRSPFINYIYRIIHKNSNAGSSYSK